MSTFCRCDAPGCDLTLEPPESGEWPWFSASIQVTAPREAIEIHSDEHGVGWGWWVTGRSERIDACTLEHLRMAMAHKIADLTDEAAG